MTLPRMLPSSALYGLPQAGTGQRTQMAELLLHPCPRLRLRQRLLTRPDGTHAAQAQVAGHHMKENEQNYDASIKCFNFVTHHL